MIVCAVCRCSAVVLALRTDRYPVSCGGAGVVRYGSLGRAAAAPLSGEGKLEWCGERARSSTPLELLPVAWGGCWGSGVRLSCFGVSVLCARSGHPGRQFEPVRVSVISKLPLLRCGSPARGPVLWLDEYPRLGREDQGTSATCCVTVGEPRHVSEPQLLHL